MRWKINKTSVGPPYHVELVGPYKLSQVEDRLGFSDISSPNGAVFQSPTNARRLCALANASRLEHL